LEPVLSFLKPKVITKSPKREREREREYKMEARMPGFSPVSLTPGHK
jgi:hypothetical protein